MKKLISSLLIAVAGIGISTSSFAWGNHYYYGNHYHYGYGRSWVGPAIVGGLAAGAVISTMQPPVVYAPPPVVYQQPYYIQQPQVIIQPGYGQPYYRGY